MRALLAVGLVAALAPASGRAIDLLPFDYVPAPAGTTAFLGYYIFGTRSEFRTTTGVTLEDDTGLDTHVLAARVTHWNEIAGVPVAGQLILPFGVARNGRIGGAELNDSEGFFDPTITLAFWPISDFESGTHLAVANYFTVPLGDYDDDRPFSFGQNRFRNDLQIGFSQALPNDFVIEGAVDWIIYGDNDDPFGGDRLEQEDSFEAYGWLAYRPSPAWWMAAGYAGGWGGKTRLDGVDTGARTDFQQLRVAYGRFFSPTQQVVGSLGRDVDAEGGFLQDVVVQLRVLMLF